MTGIFVAWSDRANSPGWIEDGTGCEIWMGARNSGGYGHATVNGRTQLVHRLRYEREIGPIPDGLQLDHFACDNRGCCNPRHCRPVTNRENVLRGDGLTSQCRAKTHCPKGHPYSGDNVRMQRGRKRCRHCRQCHREWNRAYRARAAATKNLNRELPDV